MGISTRVDAIIFDFGGVFIESPFPALEVIGAEMGIEPERLREALMGPADDSDHPFHLLERGEITLQQARDDILSLGRSFYNLELDIFHVFALLPHALHYEMVDRAKALKAEGYRTAMITNNIREFADGWRAMLPVPVDDLFELVVDSSYVGVRKPNPAIFRLALERLGGLAPERTVFLDDFEGNVKAAKLLGMKTVHVRGEISRAIAELDALLR